MSKSQTEKDVTLPYFKPILTKHVENFELFRLSMFRNAESHKHAIYNTKWENSSQEWKRAYNAAV